MNTIMCLSVWGHSVCPSPSGNRDHLEGGLLNCMNLKGALGDVVSSGLPPWDDGVGEYPSVHLHLLW